MKFFSQLRLQTPSPETDPVEREHRELVERASAALKSGTQDADWLARVARRLEVLDAQRTESAKLMDQARCAPAIVRHTATVGWAYFKVASWSFRKAAGCAWFSAGCWARAVLLRARGR